jgi:hypothetical protein
MRYFVVFRAFTNLKHIERTTTLQSTFTSLVWKMMHGKEVMCHYAMALSFERA